MPELDWKAWGALSRFGGAGVVGFLSAQLRLHPLRSCLSPLEESKVPPQTGVYGRLVTLLAKGL